MDNNLAVKLLQGWKTIPQMKEDIELFLEVVASLLTKEEGDILPKYYPYVKTSDEWKPSEIKGTTCRWDVFVKVEGKWNRVVFRYWAEGYEEPLYDTSKSRFREEEEEKPPIHYSEVPEIYEGLPLLAKGMFKLFPQFKERCEPLLKAAEARASERQRNPRG